MAHEYRTDLPTIPDSSSIAIDEGGLSLVELADDDKQTDAYLEIGGAPLCEFCGVPADVKCTCEAELNNGFDKAHSASEERKSL